MNIVETLRSQEKIDCDQFIALNDILTDRLRTGVCAVIMKHRLQDDYDCYDVDALARDICSFIIGIRDEIPLDIDSSLQDLPF